MPMRVPGAKSGGIVRRGRQLLDQEALTCLLGTHGHPLLTQWMAVFLSASQCNVSQCEVYYRSRLRMNCVKNIWCHQMVLR